MKTFVVLLLSLVCFPTYANNFDRAICGHNLPGHFVKNHCYEYAVALKEQLRIRNIASVWVGYDWERTNCRGRHVGVIFRYHDRLWFMDNLRTSPMLIFRPSTDLNAVAELSGERRVLSMVDGITGERRSPQSLESLLNSAY
jgi:uncharacterized membrane protein YbaN (DUF454 family)